MVNKGSCLLIVPSAGTDALHEIASSLSQFWVMMRKSDRCMIYIQHSTTKLMFLFPRQVLLGTVVVTMMSGHIHEPLPQKSKCYLMLSVLTFKICGIAIQVVKYIFYKLFVIVV
jgi:hypothetical protein